jgi:hypothetical protein
LFQVITALHPAGCFPSRLNGWQQERYQHSNDRNNYEQLNEGKAI